MLDDMPPLPEDPEELRAFTARLLAEVKAQAVLIEKLRHQLAGHARHRFGASSETACSCSSSWRRARSPRRR
jgi:transposase